MVSAKLRNSKSVTHCFEFGLRVHKTRDVNRLRMRYDHGGRGDFSKGCQQYGVVMVRRGVLRGMWSVGAGLICAEDCGRV